MLTDLRYVYLFILYSINIMTKRSTPYREFTAFMPRGTNLNYQKQGGVKHLLTFLGHKRPATLFDNLIKKTSHKILRTRGGLTFVS